MEQRCCAGEFAEAVREQFLAERLEFFRELQRLLYGEALNAEGATKPQLVAALCKADPEQGEKQVRFRRCGQCSDASVCHHLPWVAHVMGWQGWHMYWGWQDLYSVAVSRDKQALMALDSQ